ncbi:MAG: hypothetical protein SGPRY_004979 [Prymnesium sp.]
MRDSLGSCSILLTIETIITLQGTSPSVPLCRWLTTSAVQIILSSDTAIVPGETLVVVRDNVVHPLLVGGQLLTGCISPSGANLCASGSVSVQLPSAPLQPVALVSAPETLSFCDDLKLDGSLSHGGGVFALFFSWNVSAFDMDLAGLQPIRGLLASAPSTSSSVIVPSSLLQTGVNYTFMLQVVNHAGGVSQIATRTVVKATAVSLTTSFANGIEITTLRSSALSLLAEVTLPDEGSNVSGSSAQLSIWVRPSPLVVSIDGGAVRTVASMTTLTLDASASHDPDERGVPLANFNWSCIDAGGSLAAAEAFVASLDSRVGVGGDACRTASGELLTPNISDRRVLILAPGLLPSSRFFYIAFSASHGDRSGLATVLLELHANASPSVSLSVEQPFRSRATSTVTLQSPSERLVLIGDATPASGPCSRLQPLDTLTDLVCRRAFNWSVVSGTLDLSDPLVRRKSSSRYLVINAGAIGSGKRVTVELAVEDDGQIGRAQIEIRVALPPIEGYVSIEPSSGVQLENVFTLVQSGWFSDSLPLTFSFDFWSHPIANTSRDCSKGTEGWVPIATGLSQPRYSTRFLPIGHVIVRARATDSFGNMGCAFGNLSVHESSRPRTTLVSEEADLMLRALDMGQPVNPNAIGMIASMLLSGTNISQFPPSSPPAYSPATPRSIPPLPATPSSPAAPARARAELLGQLLDLLASLQPTIHSPPEYKQAHALALATTLSQPNDLTDSAAAQGLAIAAALADNLTPTDDGWNLPNLVTQACASLVDASIVPFPPPPPPQPPSPPPSPLAPWPPCPPWPSLPPEWGWRQLQSTSRHLSSRELLSSPQTSVREVIRRVAQHEWQLLINGEVSVVGGTQLLLTVARGHVSPTDDRTVASGESWVQLSPNVYELPDSSQLMVALTKFSNSPMGTPTPQGLPKPAIVSKVLSLEINYEGVQLPAVLLPTEQHVFALPEGKPLPWLFKCVKDGDCAGPPHIQPPVGGSCREGRCVCPSPWSGGRCEKRLECTWYSEEAGWGEMACVYEPPLECRCNVSGSFDVLVVEEAQVPLKAPQLFGISPFDLPGDLVYLADMWTHPHAAIFLFLIDAVWLVLVMLACMRSNEAKMRQNAQFYQNWREVHRDRQIAKSLSNKSLSRLGAAKAFMIRTWVQIKGQHKLVRIFFLTFDIGEDPSNRLSGAQKATVLVCIILLRLVVLSLQYNPASLEEYHKKTTAEQWLSNLVIGTFAVAVTIPGTVIMDRIFMHAQKINNAVLNSKGQPVIGTFGKVGIRLLLESSDPRWVLFRWKMVVDQLRVAWLKHEMINMRIARVVGVHGRGMASCEAIQLYPIKRLHRRAQGDATLVCTPRTSGQKKQRGSYSSFSAQRSEFAVSDISGSSGLSKEGPPSARVLLPTPKVLPAPESRLRLLLEAVQAASTIERRPVPQILSQGAVQQQIGSPRVVPSFTNVRTGKWWRLLAHRARGMDRRKIDAQTVTPAYKPSPISHRHLTSCPVQRSSPSRELAVVSPLPQNSLTTAPLASPPYPSSSIAHLSLPQDATRLDKLKKKWSKKMVASSSKDKMWKSRMLSASFLELRQLQCTLRDWYSACVVGISASRIAVKWAAKTIGKEGDHSMSSAGGGLVTRMKRSTYFGWFFNMLRTRAFWLIFPWVVSVTIILLSNFITLLYALRYYAFNETLLYGWLQSVALSKRYQVLEKFVIAPLLNLLTKGYKFLAKVLC